MMQQTQAELEQNAEIEAHMIASVEQTNWSDEPMTETEKQVVGMAVSAVLYGIREGTIVVFHDRERDVEKRPYSPDEARVAKWFSEKGVGGGDDPIGSMIASHEAMAVERNKLREEIRRLRRHFFTSSPFQPPADST